MTILNTLLVVISLFKPILTRIQIHTQTQNSKKDSNKQGNQQTNNEVYFCRNVHKRPNYAERQKIAAAQFEANTLKNSKRFLLSCIRVVSFSSPLPSTEIVSPVPCSNLTGWSGHYYFSNPRILFRKQLRPGSGVSRDLLRILDSFIG